MTAPLVVEVKIETVTRFAPSPTGLLHLGHGYSAVVGWAAAHAAGGRWRLRLEDIDTGRVRPEYGPAIHADLAWLGLAPDGPAMVQSARRNEHLAALAGLRARGLLYACTCTRADIARAASAPHAGETHAYPGTCRHHAPPASGDHAWRLNLLAVARTGIAMQQSWHDLAAGRQQGAADQFGDPVLMRRDGAIAYHLACVIDDAAQGVTLVTRGDDLVAATPVQRLLQQLLGLPEPRYLHHGLLLDAQGRRLAKRDHAATLASRRDSGAKGDDVRRQLVRQCAPLLARAGLALRELP